MSDPAPAVSPAPVPPLAQPTGVPNGIRAQEPAIVVPTGSASLSELSAFAGHDRPVGSEPLARIEDKTSRIEEKLARSEASMQRVVDRFELASTRMGEVASQAELAALRGEFAFVARRIRAIPGTAALAVTAIVTAILTAFVVILVMRYAPALLPVR